MREILEQSEGQQVVKLRFGRHYADEQRVQVQHTGKQHRTPIAIVGRRLFALAIVWALSASGAEVSPIQIEHTEQAVFGGGSSRIQTIFRNRTEQPVKLALSSRLYQASTSTLAPIEESKPFRTITVEGGQAVIETIGVKLPEVRSETTFILQWQSEERKLGRTVIYVFPRNLLGDSSALGTPQSVGLFDPDGNFGGAFPSHTTRLLKSVDDFAAFDGSLLIVAPAQKPEERATAESVVSCAKRGAGVIWIQPSPAHEIIGLPSSYVVNIGNSHVVMAPASSLKNLAQSPRAQLTMIHLAELATGRRKLDLPRNTERSEEHL